MRIFLDVKDILNKGCFDLHFLIIKLLIVFQS